jgi:hypothetical protein
MKSFRAPELKESASLPSAEGVVMTLDRSLRFPPNAADVYLKLGPSCVGLVVEPDRRSARRSITDPCVPALQQWDLTHRLPLSPLGCGGRLRCHSLSSSCNSVFLVSLVSAASCRSSSAIRAATNSRRPDFLGFSKNPMANPPCFPYSTSRRFSSLIMSRRYLVCRFTSNYRCPESFGFKFQSFWQDIVIDHQNSFF